MGIFGWSYPPGCDGPPDDYEHPCDCCGLECGQCICPECPECGDVGNTDCYRDGFLSYTPEQLKGQAELKARIEPDREGRRDEDGDPLAMSDMIPW